MDIIILLLGCSIACLMTVLFFEKEMETYLSGLVRGIVLSVIVVAEMVFGTICLESLWIRLLFIYILSICEICGITMVVTICVSWHEVKKEERQSKKLSIDSKNGKIVV